MADAEKIMPVPKLSDELDESLLPINTDAGAAAWKPLVRAAVRRTRQRLFILFSGKEASWPPCEALIRLAAVALEAAATEGKPQLDIVPLFPKAGWADLAAGKAPGKREAEVLRGAQVVFVPAAPAPEIPSSSGGPQQGDCRGGSAEASGASAQSPSRREGMRSRPAGSKAAKQRQSAAETSCQQPAAATAGGAAAGRRNSTAAHNGKAASGRDSTAAVGDAADAPETAGMHMMAAVQLAEALSAAQPQGKQPVAIGTLEPAADSGDTAALAPGSREPQVWEHVAVGGTFDRLHAGHRNLLAAAALVATKAVYIGVTGPALLQKKKHAELLESYAKREAAAADYVREVRPGLEVHTGELHDAKGLAAQVEAIQALVVSEETAAGLQPINDDRQQRGFPPLEVVTVSLVGGSGGAAAKLSSTELRAAEAARRSRKAAAEPAQDW